MRKQISHRIAYAVRVLGINLALSVATAGTVFLSPVFLNPALAQTAAEQTGEQANPPLEIERGATSQNNAPPQATEKTTDTYGDWVVNCAKITPKEGAEQHVCEASQTLKQGKTGQLVLTFKVQKLNGKPSLILVTAFGLNLAKGANISVNGAEFINQGFRTCVPRGCVVQADLNDDSLNTLSSAETIDVTLYNLDEKPIEIAISTKGLNGAVAHLNEQ